MNFENFLIDVIGQNNLTHRLFIDWCSSYNRSCSLVVAADVDLII